jgi:predicted GNAT family N-acyltransferase
MEIRQADWQRDNAAIAAIRRKVFIEEQQVPEELEWDGRDEDAIHLLAYVDGIAVATARMLTDGHIGRMSVLREYRGRGIGRQLLTQMIQLAQQRGLTQVHLDAQTHAIGFYEQSGFYCQGGTFMDAGIPHRHMRKSL